MDSQNFTAWWGAILSTALLGWSILSWVLSKPRINVTASPNVYDWMGKIEYEPGKKIIEGGAEMRQMKPFIAVEVKNLGKSATTILEIRFSQNDTPKGMKRAMGVMTEYQPFTQPLPYVIEPGHVWLCRFDQARATQNHKENGMPYFSVDIRYTHSKKWIRESIQIR